jgi:hypothetical protein
MKSLSTIIIIVFALLASCGGDNSKVVVGNKTTFSIEEEFDGGEVLKGEKVEAVFHLKNTGDYPLVVAEIKGSCTCTVVQKPEEPIAPGNTYEVKAVVDTDRTGAGVIVKNVTIVANTEPSTTSVRIKANVLQNK